MIGNPGHYNLRQSDIIMILSQLKMWFSPSTFWCHGSFDISYCKRNKILWSSISAMRISTWENMDLLTRYVRNWYIPEGNIVEEVIEYCILIRIEIIRLKKVILDGEEFQLPLCVL